MIMLQAMKVEYFGMKKYDIKEPLLSEKDQVHPLLKDSPVYFKK